MTTRKIEFSLRLRHESADLTPIVRQLGFHASAIWKRGDHKSNNPGGPVNPGGHEASYCNLKLGVAATTSLEDGLLESIARLQPKAAEIEKFVRSGGTASLAIAWFSDAVGGDRIPASVVADLARLNLTLDIYLYLSPANQDESFLPTDD